MGTVEPRDKPTAHPPAWRRAVLRWTATLLWAGAVLFCVQFALASAAELEPQAAVMGWMLVAILVAGGVAAWAMHLLNDTSPEDRV